MRSPKRAVVPLLLCILTTFPIFGIVNGVAEIKNLTVTNLQYDGESDVILTVSFIVQGDANNTTKPVDWIFIQLSSGSGSFAQRTMKPVGFSGDRLQYNIYNSNTNQSPSYIIKNKNNASSWNELIRIKVDGQTGAFVKNMSFDLKIPEGQALLNGNFKDRPLTMKLYGLLGTLGNPSTSFPFSTRSTAKVLDIIKPVFTASVAYEFKLSVVARDAAFNFDNSAYNLDYGTIDPSQVLQADMIVDSHESYSIDVVSTFGSKMKHTIVDEYIDYTFSFDGTAIPLTVGVSTNLVTSASASFTPGDRYPIDITAETIIDAPAGDYEENLTFTISAN